MSETETVKSKTCSQKRQRQKAIRVWCDETEKQNIDNKARQLKLSSSQYLRKLGLNYQIVNTVDQEAILQMAKVNGDLSRLGNLLKMYLTDPNNFIQNDYEIKDIKKLFNEIQILKAELQMRIECL